MVSRLEPGFFLLAVANEADGKRRQLTPGTLFRWHIFVGNLDNRRGIAKTNMRGSETTMDWFYELLFHPQADEQTDSENAALPFIH